MNKSYEWMLLESKKGDKNAFRLLFEAMKDELFRYIRVRVGSREDALDILQDSFTDLWKVLRKNQFAYASDAEFRGFLYTISKRRIARFYRFKKPEVSLDDLDCKEDSSEESSEARHILQTLEALNPEDKEVMRLRYFSGMNFQEIAGLLNKTESAIKVRHHRALEKLRQILGYDEKQS